MQALADKGFGRDQLTEMESIIDAEKSDIFDVLAYVAYAMPTFTREKRAPNQAGDRHKLQYQTTAILDFVLSHYASVGVDELDQETLTPLYLD